MPMSRALAKLAVATDLGTAARPSTSAPLPSGPAATAAASSFRNGSGGGGGKGGLGSARGRHGASKQSAPRNVLTSLSPLPLSNLESADRAPKGATAAAAAGAAAPLVPASAPAAASGVLLTGGGPSTPRLPPLTSHAPPPAASAPAAATVPTAVALTRAPSVGSQLPRAAPAPAANQQWATPAIHPHQNPRSHPHSTSLPPAPLPPCRTIKVSSSPGPGAEISISNISKELRDAAKNHPGLPASLLSQLQHPRRQGAPASAPFTGASAPAAPASTSPVARPGSSGGGGATVRPLSPRSRARMTASLVNAGAAQGGGAAVVTAPSTPPAPPPHALQAATPSAMAALSPGAMAVLLAAPPQQPPATPGGLLVMKRAAPAAVGSGAALRPSTAQQGHCGGGGGGGGGGAGGGSTGAGATPMSPASPARPQVVPHMTVPYKPGSIRLPSGGVPGITAAVALGGGSVGKGGSGPGSSAGSGTGSPAVPSTAAAAAVSFVGSAGDALLRPWTSAMGANTGALRPNTSNTLSYCLPTDSTAALLVRVPRPSTEAAHVVPPPYSGATTPSRGSTAALTGGRTAPSAAKSTATASAPGGAGAVRDGGRSGGSGLSQGQGDEARQLTAHELRAVVAALAAARPEAAAMLMSRPATAAAATGADASVRPTTGASRRPATSNGSVGADATAALWRYANGNLPPGSSYSSSRPSSRATTRGSLLSGSTIDVGIRDPSVYDDKWPRPTSSGSSRPGSGSRDLRSSGGGAASGAPGSAGGSSRGDTDSGRRQAATAWGSSRLPLQPIPEDAELNGGEDALAAAALAGDGGGDVDVYGDPLRPLQPLDPDPDLDTAWANIVASNLRPDTAAARAPTSGINVFSRPPTGAIRIARQAAPMVLVVEDITASTPEVLERELETLSLEELQALQAKLSKSRG